MKPFYADVLRAIYPFTQPQVGDPYRNTVPDMLDITYRGLILMDIASNLDEATGVFTGPDFTVELGMLEGFSEETQGLVFKFTHRPQGEFKTLILFCSDEEDDEDPEEVSFAYADFTDPIDPDDRDQFFSLFKQFISDITYVYETMFGVTISTKSNFLH